MGRTYLDNELYDEGLKVLEKVTKLADKVIGVYSRVSLLAYSGLAIAYSERK